MQIVYSKKLLDFSKQHTDARKSLAGWKAVTENALWTKKQDVLKDFPNARMLKNNRARFEIKHNKYRLIVRIDYEDKNVIIRFIGTHNEYEKINPETI